MKEYFYREHIIQVFWRRGMWAWQVYKDGHLLPKNSFDLSDQLYYAFAAAKTFVDEQFPGERSDEHPIIYF